MIHCAGDVNLAAEKKSSVLAGCRDWCRRGLQGRKAGLGSCFQFQWADRQTVMDRGVEPRVEKRSRAAANTSYSWQYSGIFQNRQPVQIFAHFCIQSVNHLVMQLDRSATKVAWGKDR
jgi:hypothetical protein